MIRLKLLLTGFHRPSFYPEMSNPVQLNTLSSFGQKHPSM
jgi:hypothetical protein